ncbi:endonuclease [Gandjariella thermophila]|uniref:Endonuclease n=1 Tax=Gandjariella thermophila TaxID=1931992 RepID=A0A4D4J9X2_9PSEU|nr:endonuclease [Gandjariella thermophila]GDY31209.1 endonuclease [Gandjariella thermophila]
MKVRRALDACGRTYADEAGIKLRDAPAPLYQLLVLAVLLSARIKADIAVAAARELFAAGCTTPEKTVDTTWQQRVDALGRGHYVRYDESTATTLGDGARLLLDKYGGDLRRMRKAADGDPRKLHRLLTEVKGIGPTGADIFCREVQAVWPEVRPHFDKKTLSGARELRLPEDPEKLAGMVPDDQMARFAAALVRVTLDRKLAEELRSAA